MESTTVPASVTITKMIVDFLPVLIPLVAFQALQFILSLRAAARAEATATAAKELATTTAKAVDGQMTEFKAKMEETSDLKVQVASLTALAVGKEAGAAKAKLDTLQHDQLAMARALPPDDPKIINGGKVQPTEQQTDRIEKTGDDSNQRIKKVETNTDKRVSDVEAKIDKKEDKT